MNFHETTKIRFLFFRYLIGTLLIVMVVSVYCDGNEGSPSPKGSRFHQIEVQLLNAILKKNIPRKFDFTHMDFSFLSGISIDIKRLSVSENPAFQNHPLKDYDKFYTDESMSLRIKALPLFIAKINMKEMHMEKPYMHVLRDTANRMSVDDLFKGNKGVLLSWLTVDELTVANGTLRFIDATPKKKPFVAVFSDLDTTFTGFSINEHFKVAIAVKGLDSPKQNCFFNGEAGPIRDAANFTQLPVNLDFRVIEESVAPYAAYVPPGLPYPVSGHITITYQVKGDAWTGLHMKGASTIHDLIISSDDGRNKTSIPFTLGMSLDKGMIFSIKEDRLIIDSAAIQMNQSDFIIDGAITHISEENPQADVTISSLAIDLDDIKKIYPFHEDYMPDNCFYSGRAGMNIHLKGDQKKVAISGQMDFTDTFLQVTGFFKKAPASTHILDFEAKTFPETKTFTGKGSLKSGPIEIFTPKWYHTFREALSQSFNIKPALVSGAPLAAPPSESPIMADSLEGRVAFSDDKITLESVSLVNCHQTGKEDGVDAVISGQVDLAKKSLNLTGEVVLPRKDSTAILSSKEAGAKTIVPDSHGRVHLPITISGDLMNPVVRLDRTILKSL